MSLRGHVFVTRGDLTHLSCDAVLVPSGTAGNRRGHVARQDHWGGVLGSARGPDGFVDVDFGGTRVAEVRGGTKQRPAVWLGHSGDVGKSAAWYGEVIGQFVEAAGSGVRKLGHAPLDDSRPVLAVPLVGVGLGGAHAQKGAVVRAVVERIAAALERVEADVVLVLRDAEAFSAAQKARAEVMPRLWDDIGDHETTVRALIGAARRGSLVPFVGAGASMGAGAPSWGGLLKALAREAEVPFEELERLDARDAGAVLERHLGDDLRSHVVKLTKRGRISLVHQLIASLPVKELVTTNYDQGLEVALADAGRPVKVLPRQSIGDADRWLLKLHGSVDDQPRIVLSRDDYLRFEGAGVALAGIVQALLLTRRMLFVGYSLSDDNFHRLVHQVRSAVGERPREPFATALTPQPLGLLAELWKGQVEYVSTARDGVDDARRTAIFLDRIVAGAAAPAAHVLDRSYDALFTEQERELRQRLLSCWEVLDADGLSPDIREAVRDGLRSIADFDANWVSGSGTADRLES